MIQVVKFHANSLNRFIRAYLSKYFNALLQGQKSPLPVATIKHEVKTLMKSIVTEMSSPQSQNLSEKQVTMKILSVARGLGMLKKSDILSLYQLLKSEFSSSEVHKTTVR